MFKNTGMNSVILKKGREKNLLQRHPWIFSGAIERVEGSPGVGETVTVCSFDRKPLAQAAWSPQSQIAVRVWSFNPETMIDAAFFRTKLKNAFAARHNINSNAMRLVAAESDGLPGLIIDRYADWIVCQFLSAGSEYWKNTIVELLQ